MKLPNVITIDGPVASGKSSVGLMLAEKLDFFFLDTGIMYRAVTWAALENNIEIENEDAVSKLVRKLNIEIRPPTVDDGRINDILVNNLDITWKIREQEVDANVSQVSRYPIVREVLTNKQREYGKTGKIVMAGRDIGTVVMPDAELKVFLKAPTRERAIRRFQEGLARGNQINLEQVMKNVEMRDAIDSTRKVAPLVPAADAVIINTDGKNKFEVVNEILSIIIR